MSETPTALRACARFSHPGSGVPHLSQGLLQPPAVTVVMPVYNGELFLREAVDSVCGQTYRDWELLIVDDHSTDDSRRIAAEYARRDPRVKVITNLQRKGIVGALNTGLDAATGVYIARMDADDISLPERFAQQVAYLETHPEVALCGTWVRMIGAASTRRRYPTDPERLRAFALFNCPLAHPTVMWRRAWFERQGLRYDAAACPEDYELWARVVTHFPAANLGRVLLHYRIHAASSSSVDWSNVDAQAAKISGGLLARLGLNADADELRLHRHIAQGRSEGTREFLGRADAWLARVAAANAASRWSAPEAFHSVAADLWFALCFHSVRLGSGVLRTYAAAPFAARGPDRIARLTLLGLAVVKHKCWSPRATSGTNSCAC